MGANSSGKSTALQTLLVLKQTGECNSPDIGLLLSGKYVTLGDYDDVVNDKEKAYIKIGVSSESSEQQENYGENNNNSVVWKFQRDGSKNGHIALSCVELNVDGESVILESEGKKQYHVMVNGRDTRYIAEINHLELSNIEFEYDEVLNENFREYLNKLSACLLKKNKSVRIEKNTMTALYGLNSFYGQLFKEVQRMEIQYGIK